MKEQTFREEGRQDSLIRIPRCRCIKLIKEKEMKRIQELEIGIGEQ